MRVSEHLFRSADIVRRGWCRGAMGRTSEGDACLPARADATQRCILGALELGGLEGGGKASLEAVGLATMYICRAAGLTCEDFLAEWNDDESRSAREVEAALRRAGALAMNDEAAREGSYRLPPPPGGYFID